MTNLRLPFRLNVGFLTHGEVGVSHEFPFEFQRIRLGDDLELTDFAGAAEVGRTAQGLLFTGDFTAKTVLECVRCLRPFDRQLHWALSELYAFTPNSVSDSGLTVPEDEHIDLGPLMREYALLEIPINPICRTNCQGLCPVCGQDLNVRDCGHRPENGPSSFAELKDFLAE